MEETIAALKKQVITLRHEINTLKQNATGQSRGIGHINDNTNKYDVRSTAFWEEINSRFERADHEYIKLLIRDKTVTMFDTDIGNNQTLLIIAAKWGNHEIVELCINLGSNVDHKDKDGLTALDHARNGAFYLSEQILLFNQKQMNANKAKKVKGIYDIMSKQKGFIENILNELPEIGEQAPDIFKKTAMELMIRFILKRMMFSDDFLNLCWKIAGEDDSDPLESDLWAAISTTCTEIIAKGTKRDWFWFKTCIIDSTIWYQQVKHTPITTDDDKDDEKQQHIASIDTALMTNESEVFTEIYGDKVGQSYLYYKLLNVLRDHSKHEMVKLETKLNAVRDKNNEAWDALCSWYNDERWQHPRNDSVPNSIKPKYSYSEITKYSVGKFNAAKFYDFNAFLSELILLGRSVDNEFQKSVQQIFEINKKNNIGRINNEDDEKTNGIVVYKRLSVMDLEGAQNEAEDEFFHRKFPTTACILSINRCELIFSDVAALLMGLKILKNKVENGNSGSIIRIVADKNGFFGMNKKETLSYAEIKMNVLIKGKERNIVGQITFLLYPMLTFKSKSNNYMLIRDKQKDIKECIQTILPILLDENRQLVAAGNSNDIGKFLSLMVINNKTEKDLIKMVSRKTSDGIKKRTVFHGICIAGRYKSYVFVKSVLSKQRFIDNLFIGDEANWNPIEFAIFFGHIKIIDDILRENEIIERYRENEDNLFRLIIWSFAICDNDIICDKIINKFNIDNEKMIQLLEYQYTEPIINEYKSQLTKHYHKMKLLNEIISNNTLNRLQKLVAMIGEDTFAQNVFIYDGNDKNALQVAVINNKMDMIKYMLSIQQIYDAAINDNDILYRIVCGLNENYSPEITEYVLLSLELNDENKLQELNIPDDVIQTLLQ